MSIDRLAARDWLKSLGVLVAGSMSVADARERIATYCPLLEQEFAPEIFNARSLAFVAQRQKYFPSFHEVCMHLTAWAEDRTPPKRLAITDQTAEVDWKAQHARERAEAKADWSDPAKVRRSRDNVLSSPVRQLEFGRMLAALVKRHAPQNLPVLPPEWREDAAMKEAAE